MTATALPAGGFNGPNGMTADKDGAVLLCQHGNRRIARIDKDMKVSTLVDKFEGKKLNSPNDLVFHSDGSLYFTDPPYGLPKADDDPAKELKFNGVYRLAERQTAGDRQRPDAAQRNRLLARREDAVCGQFGCEAQALDAIRSWRPTERSATAGCSRM